MTDPYDARLKRCRGCARRSHAADPAAADSAGAETAQVSLNRGVLPHEMFAEQIRRFARDVLPALQADKVARVPIAAEVPA